MIQRLPLVAAFSPLGTSGLNATGSQLCNGKSVVSPTSDWVWSTGANHDYPSCSMPRLVNNAQMCEGDPTSIVLQASGAAECLASKMDDCAFSMYDLETLDFEVQMINCKGTWAAPLWMSPNHWEGGGDSGEVDMLENCPSNLVRSNFAGGGDQVEWTDNGDDFTAHVSMLKQSDGDGVKSIHVKACQYSELKGDGTCPESGAAYLRDIYGKYGCSRGDCTYHMISDLWNGVDGDGGWIGCTDRVTNYGSECQYSISNIRTKGVPFVGKCAAMNQAVGPAPSPPPASSVVSISSKQSNVCLDLKDGVEANGGKLQIYSCDRSNPSSNQRWLRRGTEIVHQSSGGADFCVDIPSNDHTNGNKLQIWTCAGSPQQQWEQDGDALKSSGTCMDLTDGDTTNGNEIQIWGCSSSQPNQQWSLTSVR